MTLVANLVSVLSPYIETMLIYLTIFAQLALFTSLIYYLLKKAGYDLAENDRVGSLKSFVSQYSRYLAFLVALTATSGSLFYSEIMGYTPCRLCWFQRIFMYPLVILIAVGIFTRSDDLKDYVLPLTIIGAPIALIHSLIQRFEQFSSAGCSVTEVSCATEYTFHFGYITIPVMALTAFLTLILLIWRFEE